MVNHFEATVKLITRTETAVETAVNWKTLSQEQNSQMSVADSNLHYNVGVTSILYTVILYNTGSADRSVQWNSTE